MHVVVVRYPGRSSRPLLAIALAVGMSVAGGQTSLGQGDGERLADAPAGQPAGLLAEIIQPLRDLLERFSVTFGDEVAGQTRVTEAEPARPGRSERDAGVTSLSPWRGGVDLYRRGVFSTQGTWRWCTAAGVQMMRNIVHRRSDQSRTSQRRYFSYMRARDRYAIPLADGVDPAGWAAGLRRWVDPSYRIVANGSFRAGLRSAVKRLRVTGLPVAIAVARGAHAWVLTGFTATADPARTSRFRITSVRVSGPLWGLQNRSFGYDMRPNTRLTPAQLRRFFTPWHYPRIRMAWEGRWVSIQPVGAQARP